MLRGRGVPRYFSPSFLVETWRKAETRGFILYLGNYSSWWASCKLRDWRPWT